MRQTPAASDDVYGVGALLFELLTGRPVFTKGDIVQQIQKVAPPKVSEVRAANDKAAPAIPAAWDETIAACLSKAPDARPQTPGQVAAKLLAATPAAAAPKRKPAEFLAERAAEFKAGNAAASSAESTVRSAKKKPAEILAERAAQHKAGILEDKPAAALPPAPAVPEAPPAPPKKKPAEILAERASQFKAENGAAVPQKSPDTSRQGSRQDLPKRKPKNRSRILRLPVWICFSRRASRVLLWGWSPWLR